MIVYITGVSRGLGKALAENYLVKNHQVFGIGKSNSLEHKNYSFISCDLSDSNAVENLTLNFPKKSEVLLINNAGIIGEIKRISQQLNEFSVELFQINTLSPIQLTRKFSIACQKSSTRLTILNISSGAARRAIPGWANYCASKSALDMFSECFQLEEIERGSNTRIFSLAPGIIDTYMQNKIRSSNKDDFSALDNFIQLKKNNELRSPEETAKNIIDSLEKNLFETVICRL
jgi:benzil reductase ((S)-benzoin forming)